MMQFGKRMLVLALLAAGVADAPGFSLMGPPKPWQLPGFGGRPQGLGYSLLGDIGAPMSPLEGYRWNVPVITYGFDGTFLRYFGTNGVNAIEEAVGILNSLPAASAMTASLTGPPPGRLHPPRPHRVPHG